MCLASPKKLDSKPNLLQAFVWFSVALYFGPGGWHSPVLNSTVYHPWSLGSQTLYRYNQLYFRLLPRWCCIKHAELYMLLSSISLLTQRHFGSLQRLCGNGPFTGLVFSLIFLFAVLQFSFHEGNLVIFALNPYFLISNGNMGHNTQTKECRVIARFLNPSYCRSS